MVHTCSQNQLLDLVYARINHHRVKNSTYIYIQNISSYTIGTFQAAKYIHREREWTDEIKRERNFTIIITLKAG